MQPFDPQRGIYSGSLSTWENHDREESQSGKKILLTPSTLLPRPYDCLPEAAVRRGGGRGAPAPFS